jgi:hypothetical protein
MQRSEVVGYINTDESLSGGFQSSIPVFIDNNRVAEKTAYEIEQRFIKGSNASNPTVIEIIDVSGLGKTTLISEIASKLGLHFARVMLQYGSPFSSIPYDKRLLSLTYPITTQKARIFLRQLFVDAFGQTFERLRTYVNELQQDSRLNVPLMTGINYEVEYTLQSTKNILNDVKTLLRYQKRNLLFCFDEIQVFSSEYRTVHSSDLPDVCNTPKDLQNLLLSSFFNTLAEFIVEGNSEDNSGAIIFAVIGTYGQNTLLIHSPVTSLRVEIPNFEAETCQQLFSMFWHFPNISSVALSKMMHYLSGPPRLLQFFFRLLLVQAVQWKKEGKVPAEITEQSLWQIVRTATKEYMQKVSERFGIHTDFQYVRLYLKLYLFPTLYGGYSDEETTKMTIYPFGSAGFNLLEKHGATMTGGLLRLHRLFVDIPSDKMEMDDSSNRRNKIPAFILHKPFPFVKELFIDILNFEQNPKLFDKIKLMLTDKGHCFEYLLAWELCDPQSLLFQSMKQRIVELLSRKDLKPRQFNDLQQLMQILDNVDGYGIDRVKIMDDIPKNVTGPMLCKVNTRSRDKTDFVRPLKTGSILLLQAKNQVWTRSQSDTNYNLSLQAIDTFEAQRKVVFDKDVEIVLCVLCSLHNFTMTQFVKQGMGRYYIILKGDDFNNLKYPFAILKEQTKNLKDPNTLLEIVEHLDNVHHTFANLVGLLREVQTDELSTLFEKVDLQHKFKTDKYTLLHAGSKANEVQLDSGTSQVHSDNIVRVRITNISTNKKTKFLKINIEKDTLENVIQAIQQKFGISEAIITIKVNNDVDLEDDNDIRDLKENDTLYFKIDQ